jgi:hypothetical protein
MNDEIDELLSKWYDLKETINNLENKMKEYKVVAEKLMEKNNTSELKNRIYQLQKKTFTRHTMTKEKTPTEIWNQYSQEHVCNSFYITKIGEKRRSRSRTRSVKKKINTIS